MQMEMLEKFYEAAEKAFMELTSHQILLGIKAKEGKVYFIHRLYPPSTLSPRETLWREAPDVMARLEKQRSGGKWACGEAGEAD